MTKNAKDTKTAWIDPDDAPELTDEMLARADVYEGDTLIRRGRPPKDESKRLVSLRLDPDLLEYFRASGPGWQTRINDILRAATGLPKAG